MKATLGLILFVSISAAAKDPYHTKIPPRPKAPAKESPASDFDRLRAIRLLGPAGVGAEEFLTREKAMAELIGMGPELLTLPAFQVAVNGFTNPDKYPYVDPEVALRAVRIKNTLQELYTPYSVGDVQKRAGEALKSSDTVKTLDDVVRRIHVENNEVLALDELLEKRKGEQDGLNALRLDTRIAAFQEAVLKRAGLEVEDRGTKREGGQVEMRWQVKDTATGKRFTIRSRENYFSIAENTGFSLEELGAKMTEEKGKKLAPGAAFPKQLAPKAFDKGSEVFVGAVSDWFREKDNSYTILSAPQRTVAATGVHAPDPSRHQDGSGWLEGTAKALNFQLFGTPYVRRP